MNLPPPMASSTYDKIVDTIVDQVKTVAEETMMDASDEIKLSSITENQEFVDTSISCDGSWQRRQMGTFKTNITKWCCHCNFYGNWKNLG